MIYITPTSGKPVHLDIGRAFNGVEHLVFEQAGAKIAIPTTDLFDFADTICEVAEILDKRADPARPSP